jgi:hypothetical protein
MADAAPQLFVYEAGLFAGIDSEKLEHGHSPASASMKIR